MSSRFTTQNVEVILVEIEKLILTFTQKCKGHWMSKQVQKNKVEGLILPGFMNFYKCCNNQDNVELSEG